MGPHCQHSEMWIVIQMTYEPVADARGGEAAADAAATICLLWQNRSRLVTSQAMHLELCRQLHTSAVGKALLLAEAQVLPQVPQHWPPEVSRLLAPHLL